VPIARRGTGDSELAYDFDEVVHFPVHGALADFQVVPAKLGKAYYALATIHGAFGTVTELAGLYILLSAGTTILPEKLRITRYKVWMQSVLVFWWVVLLLGIATYTRWYIPHLLRK
jgi:hypothetical protein